MNEDQKKIESAKEAEYQKKKKAKKEVKKKQADKGAPAADEEQFENRIYWGFQEQPINFEVTHKYYEYE